MRRRNLLPGAADTLHWNPGGDRGISLPTQRVLNQIKFEKGNFVLVIAGRSSGRNGKILEMQKGTATRPAMVTIEDPTGSKFETVVDYTFVVGTDKPTIKLEAT